MTNNQQCGTIVLAIILGFILVLSWIDSNTPNRPFDPIAKRIEAIDSASWDMSDVSRERILMEVLKGETNSIPLNLESK